MNGTHMASEVFETFLRRTFDAQSKKNKNIKPFDGFMVNLISLRYLPWHI